MLAQYTGGLTGTSMRTLSVSQTDHGMKSSSQYDLDSSSNEEIGRSRVSRSFQLFSPPLHLDPPAFETSPPDPVEQTSTYSEDAEQSNIRPLHTSALLKHGTHEQTNGPLDPCGENGFVAILM